MALSVKRKGNAMLQTYWDGCIVPNIPTKEYQVFVGPKCPHVRIVAAVIIVRAISAESAEHYVSGLLRLPRTIVIDVKEIRP